MRFIANFKDSTMPRQGVLWLAALLLSSFILLHGGCGSGEPSTPAGEASATVKTVRSAPVDTTPEIGSGATSTATVAATVPVQAKDVVSELLAAYSVQNELDHIFTLASDDFQGRRFGSAGGRAAADYIESQFSQLGLEPWTALGLSSFRQQFTSGGVSGVNLIAQLPGSSDTGPYLILAAHFDHLGLDASGNVFNGADDNAAGVAAVLEAARIFADLDVSSPRTMIFCAFDGEEEGELGAVALGNLLVSTGLAPEVEMINIDGIGAIGGSYFGVWDEGSAEAAPLVAALTEAGARLGTTVQNDGTDIGSDAQPFDWRFGIPAVTVDWNWGYDPGTFHPYYHTINDDPEYIDRDVLAAATEVALTGFWIRASQPE